MKALYKPKGKAGEYASWACNFFNGCSNDCEYCYCKRGVLSHVWSDKPYLKKCFKSEEDALRVFAKEVEAHKEELQKTGVFFSFSTDPLLQATAPLTFAALAVCNQYLIPVQILTKCANFEIPTWMESLSEESKKRFAFGFTLTGCDSMEPYAALNCSRIMKMKGLHKVEFKTFASIEPIIDPSLSMRMIRETRGFCNLYKVGTVSGRKTEYGSKEIRSMLMLMAEMTDNRFYLKDSFLKLAGCSRQAVQYLPFVNSDYNIFNN